MMDIKAISWILALIFGTICFIGGLLNILIKVKRNGTCEEKDYGVSILLEIAANWILNIPDQFLDIHKGSISILYGIEATISALLTSLKNGYVRVVFAGQDVFTSLYAIVNILASIALYIFLAGFVIKFFEELFHKLKLVSKTSKKNATVYLMSGCNEKTLALAESIDSENIIFATTAHADGEIKKRLAKIGAVHIGGTVEEILIEYINKRTEVELFLFEKNEYDNLNVLESVCDLSILRKIKKMRIFVELKSTPCDLYDGYLQELEKEIGEKKLIVNFVRTEENYAYNNLLKHSIFDNYVEGSINGKETKMINILFVGMNERVCEMLKAVLHLGQMPGFFLSVLVIEDGKNRERIRQLMPEVGDECLVEGDAFYKYTHIENVNLSSGMVETIIAEKMPMFTFAYINASDDLFNLNMAMRMNALRYRLANAVNYSIQVCALRLKPSEKWNKDIIDNIKITGSFKRTYDYNFITMSDIEKGTKAIHDVRQNDKKKSNSDYKIQTWEEYCNNEYNRHSVYARTLSFKYKVQLIDEYYDGDYSVTRNDVIWKIYEHMRWDMYTRSTGRQLPSKAFFEKNGIPNGKVRKIARLHEDLVLYDDLSKEEKDKDALRLTPEIISILKGI